MNWVPWVGGVAVIYIPGGLSAIITARIVGGSRCSTQLLVWVTGIWALTWLVTCTVSALAPIALVDYIWQSLREADSVRLSTTSPAANGLWPGTSSPWQYLDVSRLP